MLSRVRFCVYSVFVEGLVGLHAPVGRSEGCVIFGSGKCGRGGGKKTARHESGK